MENESIKAELADVFSQDYINTIGLMIYSLAEVFYTDNKLDGKVYFNEDIFDKCLIDLLVDLARLKHFHDIKKLNMIKIYAYAASWCLRRKPFQLVEGCDEEYIFVNEKFALSVLAHASGIDDCETGYIKGDEESMLKNLNLMYYHLKYRNVNPQTLESMLVGIQLGKSMSDIV